MNFFRPLCFAAMLLGLLGQAERGHARAAAHHGASGRKALGAAKAARHASAPESDWLPDPDRLAQMGTETPFDVYTLRLPPGMHLVRQYRKEYPLHIMDIASYEGEARPDGTCSILEVGVLTARPNAFIKATADQLLPMMDYRLFAHGSQVVKSPSEYGRINGLETLRQYFKMTEKGKKLHGLLYYMNGMTSAVTFVAIDSEPSSTDSLPLAETCILTLNKQ